LPQWFPYESGSATDGITAPESLSALTNYMLSHHLEEFEASTELMIVPSYRYRIVGGLVTNFHQPQSTLLLLVSALVGDRWREIYDYALQHEFRFLSYGDGSLLYGVKC
jgi:S-adenosylmethionine:tRNA ribosyltransferase-isomerase